MVCFWMVLLLRRDVIDEQTFGIDAFYAAVITPCCFVMLLGIMPVDKKIIRWLSFFWSFIFILWGCSMILLVLKEFGDRNSVTENHIPGESYKYYCATDLPIEGCVVLLFRRLANGAGLIAAGVAMTQNLFRVKSSSVDDLTVNSMRLRSVSNNSSNQKVFKIQTGKALQNIWFIGRTWTAYAAVVLLICALTAFFLGDRAPYYSIKNLAGDLFDIVMRFLCAFWFSEKRRCRATSWLTWILSQGSYEQAMSETCISALLRGEKITDILPYAEEQFRSISCADMPSDCFDTGARSLHDKTFAQQLGNCDAYISHSGGDDSSTKFAALQKWASEFKRTRGRQPTLWFDKACVQEYDTTNHLLCLPIFLGACETLLILAGPTYPQRLWCILEVFVFLQMGGRIENVTILPVGLDDEHDAATMFDNVDVVQCKCGLERDRAKILSIIQQGFIDFSSFNNIIRGVFANRISASLTFEEWQIKLEEVAQASNRLRRRIVLCTTGIGFLFLTMVLPIRLLLLVDLLDYHTVGHFFFYDGLITPFGLLILFGIMPNDVMIIRAVSLFLISSFLGLGLLDISISLHFWFVGQGIDRVHEGDFIDHACGSDVPSLGCAFHVAKLFMIGLVSCLVAPPLLSNVSRFQGSKFWDRSKQEGFRFNDSAFRKPARLALDRIWFCGRLWACGTGLSVLGPAIVLLVYQDRAPYYTRNHFASDIFNATVRITLGLLLTDNRRRHIKAFLSSINVEDQTVSAACVGALLGGHKISESLSVAKSRFRSICSTSLSQDDFVHRAQGLQRLNLHGRTSQAVLGEVDAFVSHSWSDNATEKYEVIEQWSKDFKSKNGRDPHLWFDQACVKKAEISIDLMCLPLFLTGCETLLVVAGPSYADRMWCVLEVFVFLKMGGNASRIKILPIEGVTEKQIKKKFKNVDIEQCKCSLESDRQKILGIVEQGFGNFEDFNSIVQQSFEDSGLATRKTSGIGSFRLSSTVGSPQYYHSIRPSSEREKRPSFLARTTDKILSGRRKSSRKHSQKSTVGSDRQTSSVRVYADDDTRLCSFKAEDTTNSSSLNTIESVENYRSDPLPSSLKFSSKPSLPPTSQKYQKDNANCSSNTDVQLLN